MEFGYLEPKIDESYETRMRRIETLKNNFYGTENYKEIITPYAEKVEIMTREERQRRRLANILRKRRELIRLVNKKMSINVPSIQLSKNTAR